MNEKARKGRDDQAYSKAEQTVTQQPTKPKLLELPQHSPPLEAGAPIAQETAAFLGVQTTLEGAPGTVAVHTKHNVNQLIIHTEHKHPARKAQK